MQTHRTATREGGFSLIELLLVLTIIGIISAIAIPMLMGQRNRARRIGDAQANANVLAMMLETRKAESAVYGPAGTYTWTNSGGVPSPNLAPSFQVKNGSEMNFTVIVGNNGLGYTLTVNDKTGTKIFQTDQTGAKLYP